jgi:uncharacterized protein YlxW (UPF0749 family)
MNNRPNIYSIITLCIVLFIAYTYFFKTDDSFVLREQLLQNKIDSLNTKVAEFKIQRDSLDNNINNLNDSVLTLQSAIVNKSNQIYKLKKAYAKKVEHINNYTVSDINEYLSDRYKK